MEIKSTTDKLIVAAENYPATVETRNYRLGNKLQDDIDIAARYLRDNDKLNELYPLLNHKNIEVRLTAAYYILSMG